MVPAESLRPAGLWGLRKPAGTLTAAPLCASPAPAPPLPEEALHWAGCIGAVTGASLLCEGAFARVERGCGLPSLTRLPYFPQVG